jgi:hypothetical protein
MPGDTETVSGVSRACADLIEKVGVPMRKAG